MDIEVDSRYLCTMKGKTLYVHSVVPLDRLKEESLPYKWTYAITQSYMHEILNAGKVEVIWYQQEFDFGV